MASASLARRIVKLEAAMQWRGERPCRWHDGIVIVDDDVLSLGDPRRRASPLCEAPGRCPSGGLQIWILDPEDDDEPERPR